MHCVKSIFCMTYERIHTKVQISYNPHTDHITISSGFTSQIKYCKDHHKEKIRKNRDYNRTHRKKRALYRVKHSAAIARYNQKYCIENSDKIRVLSKTSHNNPERKRKDYIRNRDRYHIKLRGVCSICNLEKKTEIHHLFYPDIFDPKAIIEVCLECHRAIENKKYLESIGALNE